MPDPASSELRPPPGEDPIRIGISACLLGDEVRYDGGHKRDPFLTDTVGRFVTWVRVCPEVELGLGTPRETIQLVEREGSLKLLGTRSETDHTDAMHAFAARRTAQLEEEDLCGYIFKKGSPSCGVHGVKVYGDGSAPSDNGRGLFAAGLIERMPLLPVEEEGRLHDAGRRESFFERVFAYRRVRRFFGDRWSAGGLVRFHTAEKMLMLAHDRASYTALGRLVARAKELPRAEVVAAYPRLFMNGLSKIATTRKHTDVLQHMAGHFKKVLDGAGRAELLRVIEDFRRGRVPRVVPVTLIRDHARAHGVGYIAGQTYMDPHPEELMLRDHV